MLFYIYFSLAGYLKIDMWCGNRILSITVGILLFATSLTMAADRVRVICMDYSNRDLTELDDCREVYKFESRSVSFSNNNLQSLARNFPTCFCKINQVDISNNSFKRVPLEAFSGLHELHDLNADNNEISSLRGRWEPLSNLTSISVANNRIADIPSEYLENIPQLLVANFSHNNIRYVPRVSGLNSSSIILIDLRHNKLEDLSLSYFAELDYVDSVTVSDWNIVIEFQRNNAQTELEIIIGNIDIGCDEIANEKILPSLHITRTKCLRQNAGTTNRQNRFGTAPSKYVENSSTPRHSGAATQRWSVMWILTGLLVYAIAM